MAQRYEQQNPGDSAKRGNQNTYKPPEPQLNPKLIKDLRYPLAPTDSDDLRNFERTNMHYVKFYINIDEESSIIRGAPMNGAWDMGYIDQSDQNRANRGLTILAKPETAPEGSSNVIGAASGAAIGGALTPRLNAGVKMAKFLGKGPMVAGAVIGASIGEETMKEIGQIAVDELALTKRLKRLGHTISLYTPAGIASSYEFGYNSTDAHLVNLAQSDTIDSIKKGISSFTSSGKEAVSAAAKMARILAVGGNTDMSILSRTALNPRKDMLFQGVGNRSFTFDYQFAPRSPEEAKEVEHIIYLFKYFSHPEIIEGYGQYLFSYPAEFDIDYFMIQADGEHRINPYLNRISSCVLDRVTVAYAPNGSYQSLLQGEPLIINMSLKFTEIEILHRGRIEKGY